MNEIQVIEEGNTIFVTVPFNGLLEDDFTRYKGSCLLHRGSGQKWSFPLSQRGKKRVQGSLKRWLGISESGPFEAVSLEIRVAGMRGLRLTSQEVVLPDYRHTLLSRSKNSDPVVYGENVSLLYGGEFQPLKNGYPTVVAPPITTERVLLLSGVPKPTAEYLAKTYEWANIHVPKVALITDEKEEPRMAIELTISEFAAIYALYARHGSGNNQDAFLANLMAIGAGHTASSEPRSLARFPHLKALKDSIEEARKEPPESSEP